jgi:hypothetical protein
MTKAAKSEIQNKKNNGRQKGVGGRFLKIGSFVE